MIGNWSHYINAFERFLRIGPEMSAEKRLRARVIYLSCLGFLALLVSNLIYFMVCYDGFALKRPILAATCVIMVLALLMVRWTKSPIVYGLFFTAFPLSAVWISARYSVAAKTSEMLGGGIHTPTLPILCVGVVLAAIVGTRLTTMLYAVLFLALVIALNRMSGAAAMSAEFSVITELRSMQISVAVSLLGITAFTLSRLAYSALAKIEGALRRATRAEAARKELLATMSHEIRTPLNGIISVSDLLGKGDHSETTQAHLNIIEMSASNLLAIVNESLGRARSEHLGEESASAIQINSQPFDPSNLLQQTCDLFSANASEKGLWIGTYGLEALPNSLLGDAPHLRQVLNNLVGNAIKFTHQGGVRIGARLVGSSEANQAVQFFVQDTGVGIEDDAKARVFERFGQSMSALTTEADGTGLGLAICNDLVTAMGGTLEMDSTVGVGTAFYFTLLMPIAVDSMKPVAA